MKQVARVALLFLLLGCAALTRREKVKLSEDRLNRARALDAAHLAAEPFSRFEAALHAAESLPEDAPARDELVSEARLWLETAIAEAETASLARERLTRERETLRHDQAYLAAERERLALEDERERALAAEIARSEAARALSRAAEAPRLRVRLNADETRRAALSLLARAELIALAVSPDGQAAARAALLAQVREARGRLAKAPDEALKQADQALFAGLSLVGQGRTAEQPPTAEQKASLAEALALLGAAVSRLELGLSATLAQKASPSGVARLCELARDYPAGRVRVALGAGALGKESGPALLAKHGCTGARFELDAATRDAHLSFTFLAY